MCGNHTCGVLFNDRPGKRLLDLDYDGVTIKKATGNSQGVKRLNKNLCMGNFWVIVIKALKKMLASV